ncbi:MAG TPA: TonB-dependent receptor [Pedobacter sp.]|uniref:TonB-dependent receptor n=1 Tax=Pedobacter sp. TaxID=1411316 RepID=UPI002C64D2DC|nr:TonB-dependent receptor [Pedobacter sp.]HMI05542.1 TonB-dependent receptor [Pedobacter sp.]
MKTLLALLILTAACLFASAQNKASLKGIVTDSLSKSPLEFATVAVVNAKDTSLVAYTITEKNGLFKLTGLPVNRGTKLIISYIGYHTYRQILDLKPGEANDLGQISLSGKSLNEVIIKGERSPVVMRKDTIEFNAEAFKTRPNATVEELLMLLPGVQVNMDGGIVINGTGSSKVLVNGKVFFGANGTVATKNLDADMIDKIQVYDDRDDDPLHKMSQIDVKKIINLKLKSAIKKNTIGKVYAGAGTRERYDVGGIFSTFRDTLQVSLISSAGNSNTRGYGYGDLNELGGFQRSGSSRVNQRNFYGDYVNGFVNNFSNAININNDYGTRLKVNLAYYNVNSSSRTMGKSLTEQTIDSTLLTSSAASGTRKRKHTNVVEGLFEYKPDTANSFKYQPVFEYTPQRNMDFTDVSRFNTQNPMLSNSTINSNEKVLSRSFSHWFNYFHNFRKKGEVLYFGHSLTLVSGTADRYNYDNLVSLVAAQPSRLFDRYTDYNSRKNEAALEASYVYPFTKKLTVDVFSYTRYYDAMDRTLLYDRNSGTGRYQDFIPGQSTDLTRHTYIQNIKPQVIYQLNTNIEIRFGLDGEFQYLINRFNSNISDRKQRFFVVLPSLKINAKNFYLDYYVWYLQPAIADMQPITREINPLYKIVGNPDLKPTRSHNLSLNFSKYITAKKLNINGYLYMNSKTNSFVQQNVLDGNGAITTTMINSDASTYAQASAGIGKQLGNPQKIGANFSVSLSPSLNRVPFFLNGDKGTQHTYAYSVIAAGSVNYKTALRFNLNYYFSSNLTEYEDLDYRAVKTYSHTIYDAATIRATSKLSFQVTHSFTYNPNVQPGFQQSSHLMHANATLAMFKKDRGQLKLSGFDLLNQNISVNRYAGANSIVTNEQEILKRYFLLGFQYKINVTKK